MSTARPLRAAPYSRVSEDRTGQTRSVGQQDKHNLEIITREGWVPVLHPDGRTWCDNDKGASRHSRGVRGDWQQLLELISAGGLDVLVIWELSRGTRARIVWAALIEACIDRGVLINVGGKTHEPADPDDGFFLDLGMGLAVRESAMTRKRVMRDQASAAAAGRPHGKIPYGYQREYDKATGALLRQVIREDQAEVIREAARRCLAGETPLAVAADLNARGIPAAKGGPWSRACLVEILVKPSMAGLRQYRAQIVGAADWPGVLTEADYFALRERFRGRGRLKSSTDPIPREAAIKHLSSRLVICDTCEGPLDVDYTNGRRQYMCRGRGCTSAPADAADAALMALAVARLSRSDAHELFAEPDDGAARAAQAELEELETRLEGFEDEATAGRLSPIAYARIEAKLTPQIEAARRRARVASVPPVLRAVLSAPDVRVALRDLPLTSRREAIRSLGVFRLRRAGRRGPYKFDPTRLVPPWETETHDSALGATLREVDQ